MRLLPALLLAACTVCPGGDLRVRLWRRWPSCRGTEEGAYAGDEWAMMTRLRFSAGPLSTTLLTDKARGEEWGDILAGGVSWQGAGPCTGAAAGFLRADLGTGLVLSHPGPFSAPPEMLLSKAPGSRCRIEPSSSAWPCRGDPLTGAGGTFDLGGPVLAVMGAYSMVDAAGEGYHRTRTEIDGRADLSEWLGAARLGVSFGGATFACGSREGEDAWGRAGIDWEVKPDALGLTGELAAGVDTTGITAAFWGGPTHEIAGLRHTLLLLSLPEGFPDSRSSIPVGRQCDLGLVYGIRWKPLRSLTVRAGTGVYDREEGDEVRWSGEVSRRFPANMDLALGARGTHREDEDSGRGWLVASWSPLRDVTASSRVQASAWSDGDSTETGMGAGLRLRLRPLSRITLTAGATGFSTDGWESRVYSGSAAFPGEMGSVALSGRGALLFAMASLDVTEDLRMSGRVQWETRDGAASMGSGLEETEGSGRLEAGVQVDWELRPPDCSGDTDAHTRGGAP